MINALRIIQKRHALGRRAPMHARRLSHSSVICGLALLLGAGWAGEALAVCKLFGSSGPPSSTVVTSLPATTTLQHVAIGGVMAKYYVEFYGRGPVWTCSESSDTIGMGEYTTTLTAVDEAKGIYDTGVTGVGVRIKFFGPSGDGNWDTPLLPPFAWKDNVRYPKPYPGRMQVEFIRTGVAVGKGDMLPFDFETDFFVDTAPQLRISISGEKLKTKLENTVYYTSCRNASADPQVNMGQSVTIAQVRTGNVETHDFSLDIRCDGMNPTTKPAVKVYFEGQWETTGSLLKLDGAGQQDVATGAGIKLSAVRSNGSEVTLPTTKADAFALTWYRSAPDSEYYRFQGRAKYAPTGAEMKEGKAAGTLSYVLDYN